MDLSPLVPCSHLPAESCGPYIAVCQAPRHILIYSSVSLQVKRSIELDESTNTMKFLAWGKTVLGRHRLLVASDTRIQCFEMEDDDWTTSVSESEGIHAVRWIADAASLAIFSACATRLTLWSVDETAGSVFRFPKLTPSSIVRMASPRPRYAILGRQLHDVITIAEYNGSWQVLTSFQADTIDAQGIAWSDSSGHLVVWDAVVEYRALFYTAAGSLMRDFRAYDIGLGIRSVAWSPQGDTVALASCDGIVRMLDSLTLSPLVEIKHPITITDTAPDVWRERSSTATHYEHVQSSLSLPLMVTSSEEQARQGIGLLSFSTSGRYLATRNDSTPTTLWIWSIEELRCTAIVLNQNPIKQVRWLSGDKEQLVFTSADDGAHNIYIWTEQKPPVAIAVPSSGFEIQWMRSIERDPPALLIGSSKAFTIAHTIADPRDEGDATGTYLEIDTCVDSPSIRV
ncbi:hypothetical protein PYCC9005_003210 [Savitreella phatthalungensis]